jgi:hypothetical protein
MKGLIVSVALVAAGASWAQDRPSEDEIFGGSPSTNEPSPAPKPQSSSSRDEDILGGSGPSSAETGPPATRSPEHPEVMEREEKALAIGGNLFLRLNDTVTDGESMQDSQLSSPSQADVFADVRPNDRVRGFGQIRFVYDFTVKDGSTNAFGQTQKQFDLQLDQIWIKFDLGRVAYITAGRQHIRWGTGRFWNPTDFINTEVRNSVDFVDNRLGVDLIKVHFPFEQLGWNLYLLGVLDGADVLNKSGVAARAEFAVGPGEIALSSLVKNNSPLRFGLDASAGVWLLDLRTEMTVQRGLDNAQFTGDLDFNSVPPKVPTQVTGTDNNWYFRGVFGTDLTLQYTDKDNIIVGGEYFYNQTGYDNATLYPWLATHNAFTPFYLGKHYMGVYVVAASPFTAFTPAFLDTTATVSTLANLSDGSWLSRLDLQQLILTNLTINAFAAVHYGNEGELRLGVKIPPVPLVPQLVNGIDIKAPFIDTGVALRVAL